MSKPNIPDTKSGQNGGHNRLKRTRPPHYAPFASVRYVIRKIRAVNTSRYKPTTKVSLGFIMLVLSASDIYGDCRGHHYGRT